MTTLTTTLHSIIVSIPAQAASASHGETSVELVVGILLFVLAGFLIGFGGLLVGSIARPTMPNPDKGKAYECGEPVIGEGWVQFDLRFYTVALVFIVFDVEVALLWPWAVVFKDMGAPAFWAFLVFFLLIAIPFLYEWKSGFLNWVRSTSGQERSSVLEESAPVSAGGS
ncbi:MAG: NADH-quinone oxidoreductase subunit A [Phycisphaerae bacterium]|jgi:NADH-quinone oxidoreductase subunit A